MHPLLKKILDLPLGINLKLVLHRNRMKPMEKFAFKSLLSYLFKLFMFVCIMCLNLYTQLYY